MSLTEEDIKNDVVIQGIKLAGRLLIIIAFIVTTVMWKHCRIYYSLIVLGESPIVGLYAVVLLFFLCIVFGLIGNYFNKFPKLFDFISWNSKHKSAIAKLYCFFFVYGSLCLYCEIYYKTVDNIKKELMEKSHLEKGWIYKIRGPEYRGNTASRIFAGVDKDHITIHGIDYDIRKKCNMKEGDEVILRVSDDYPRVNEIIECNGIKLDSLINKDNN